MEIEPFLLLQRYRRDRRKLLDFVLSFAVAGESSADSFDLDTVSVDYVLDCVKSGGEFDPLEATKRYFEESKYPISMNFSTGDSFFLLSTPELSGSPPRRIVPPIEVKVGSDTSPCSTNQTDHMPGKRSVKYGSETTIGDFAAMDIPCDPCQPVIDANMLCLGLPALSTGLSDDDLRETAYEVLLASVVLSGSMGLTLPSEERKNGKKSRFLVGLRSKKDGAILHAQSENSSLNLLDVIRIQMEVSEAMDTCMKQGLRHIRSKIDDQADVPQISLELLSSICKSDFPNQRSYTHWQKRQAKILEELLGTSADFVANGHMSLCILLSKIQDAEEWISVGPEGRTEILTSVQGYASRLLLMPPKFGIANESYYWTASYHFNIKLYEKLLSSVFDVLEDCQIIAEAEEIIKVLKLTWPTLGITQKIHDALYAWLLFHQFVCTGESSLLNCAVPQMKKALSSNDDAGHEEAYMNSLICLTGFFGSKKALNLVDAILFNIFAWCVSRLEDYHLHFEQGKIITFENILMLALLCGTCSTNVYGGVKHIKPVTGVEAASKLVHIFVERSIQAAYRRILALLDNTSEREVQHPLATLANELKLLAETELASFIPVLCRHYPEAGAVSALALHQLYGQQLKPYLEGISSISENVHISESVRSVLAASNSLELCLTDILNLVCGDGMKSRSSSYFQPYKIRDVCTPLMLHWVNSQHDNMMEWTKRVIQLEGWEPLSSQQKQATSIVEVFRIIEETVDQFFDIHLPMDIIHLRSLLIGIFHSLDAYLLHLVNQQVDRSILYPRPPALTRYKEALNPFMRKKPAERLVVEEKLIYQLDNLTVSKLCVKLNTVYYIRDQLDTLEDSIQQSWVSVQSVNHHNSSVVLEELSASSESVDELFSIFDDIRRSVIDASNVILDFFGTRVIFWDMRDSLLSSLYRSSVETARLEIFVPELDRVLDSVCDLIIDTLRDRVVLSICQASMDGYVWVTLDGGPFRVFAEEDVAMMQEDLNILKELFIANGQGLPSCEVEKESRLAQQILDLYALKSQTIIEMLLSASEHVLFQPDPKKSRSRSAKDADTLLRILCHKKDNTASEFLKLHFQLPKSSDYEEDPEMEPSHILKRNISFSWTEKGQRSFSMMKKKFQEAKVLN